MREDDTHIVRYTIHKIKRLMPYVLVTVLASYFVVNFSLFRAGDLRGAIHQAQDLPAELLLMRAFIHTPDQMIFYCGNLWYLSALLTVLPVFCLMCKKCQKYVLMIAFVYCPLYLYLHGSCCCNAGAALPAADSGGAAGRSVGLPVVYTMAELFLIIALFAGLYLNNRNFENYVLAFVLFLAIVFFPNRRYSSLNGSAS